MDIFEFVCIMTLILVSGLLIYLKIYSTNALKLQELMEKQRLGEIRRKAANARYEQPGGDIAPWAGELIGALGISPEALFEEEMPPELKTLLPMAKGFLQGGGLQKILSKAQEPEIDLKQFI